MAMRAIQQIKRRDAVRDIHDLHFGIDLQNDSFEHAHQVVVRPIIGRQRNDRIGQDSSPVMARFSGGLVQLSFRGRRLPEESAFSSHAQKADFSSGSK